jgi:hypothetical protein
MGNKRGRTKEEIHKELQDLDPMGSPHKKEKKIGGNIDIDLLTLFPQRYERIMRGIEKIKSFPRLTMERERGKRANPSLKKGRGIYTSSQNVAVVVLGGRIIWAKWGG